MNSSAHMLSEVMAGSMTTADGPADVAVPRSLKEDFPGYRPASAVGVRS
jgi:hypothetical protein